MKLRILAFLLTIVMCLSLVGCFGDKNGSKTKGNNDVVDYSQYKGSKFDFDKIYFVSDTGFKSTCETAKVPGGWDEWIYRGLYNLGNIRLTKTGGQYGFTIPKSEYKYVDGPTVTVPELHFNFDILEYDKENDIFTVRFTAVIPEEGLEGIIPNYTYLFGYDPTYTDALIYRLYDYYITFEMNGEYTKYDDNMDICHWVDVKDAHIREDRWYKSTPAEVGKNDGKPNYKSMFHGFDLYGVN